MKAKLLALIALTPLPARAADPAVVKSEFIYETAPFPACHASTIAETKGGLVAAWFGGLREKSPDVGIWSARLRDGKSGPCWRLPPSAPWPLRAGSWTERCGQEPRSTE